MKIIFVQLILLVLCAINKTQSLNSAKYQDEMSSSFLKKQILNTQKLLKLYERKHKLLKSVSQSSKNQSSIQDSVKALNQNNDLLKVFDVKNESQMPKIVLKNQDKYILTQKFYQKVKYMYPYYFLAKNSVFYTSNQQRQNQTNLMGRVLFQDKNKIYTMIGTKIGQSKIESVYPSKIQITSQMTGYSAAEAQHESIWHYSLNQNQKDHILVSIKQNTIYLRQKKIVRKVLKVYSINQYKMFFLTEESIGIVNVMSGDITLQIEFTKNSSLMSETTSQENLKFKSGQYQNVRNPEAYENQNKIVRAKSCVKNQQTIYILLDNGTVLCYSNQKINRHMQLQSFQQLFPEDASVSQVQVVMHYVYPYLFLSNKAVSTFLIYNFSNSLFQYWTKVQIKFQQGQILNCTQNTNSKFQYQFYKLNKTIELLIQKQTGDNTSNTYRYRLLLDYQPYLPYIGNSYLWNFALIAFAVIVVWLIRSRNTQSQVKMVNNKPIKTLKKTGGRIENQQLQQIQAYLKKQGQNLTKQQIEQLIYEIQQKSDQKQQHYSDIQQKGSKNDKKKR